MKISFKTFLMGTFAVAAMASCASDGSIVVPEATLEECVYMGDKTEFAVWAPDAEAAKLRLYHDAMDETAFKTLDMKLGKDGLWKTTVKEDVRALSIHSRCRRTASGLRRQKESLQRRWA